MSNEEARLSLKIAEILKKLQQFLYSPGQAVSVAEGWWGYQISIHSIHGSCKFTGLRNRPPLTPRK